MYSYVQADRLSVAKLQIREWKANKRKCTYEKHVLKLRQRKKIGQTSTL